MSTAYVWIEVGPGRSRRVRKDQVPEGALLREPKNRLCIGTGSSPGGKRITMHAVEKHSVKEQLGRDFHDRNDLDRHMKENNLEFISPGDDAHTYRKEMREWRAQPKGTRGPPPRPRGGPAQR